MRGPRLCFARKRTKENSPRKHPNDATAASHKQHGQQQLKEPTMRKLLAIAAAFVLFAPFAYAAVQQAALIVA
jgi:hypothetical protein